jgi:fucose 4-O-acetylase-like acetyltransferase
MAKQRIEYIDAMRGFTMILVVYSHVCGFCLGDTQMGYNDVFFLFRLPCFFFISGWLFERTASQPFWSVARKKFMVQIVPTFIFLLLLAPPPLFFSRLGATKGGYWFTFALFEFFLLYMLSIRTSRKWSALLAVVLSFSAFCYDIYYNSFLSSSYNFQLSIFNYQLSVTDIMGFLSYMTWRYYLFFFIGVWVRRHFEVFLRWTSKPIIMAAIVLGFVGMAMIPHTESIPLLYLVFALGGILGMVMIFTLFRLLYSPHLLPLTFYLSPLIYIGTRTLDIYLLHYFFLPRFLMSYGEQLRSYDCKPLELVFALAVALVVVAICLLVSYVIRLNPFLGHYLFGVKYETKK